MVSPTPLADKAPCSDLAADVVSLDMKHNWHPCMQMKDLTLQPPMVVKRAYGSHIELVNGKKIIDAIASWWCKSLGHNHPRLKAALQQQAAQFEHVIFATSTHQTIAELGEKLTQLSPDPTRLNKVLYAGDGSCAVEIALKMSLHYRMLSGESQRCRFIALKNGYHGETAGALSVSDLGLYRSHYKTMLFEPILIEPPYLHTTSEPAWQHAATQWQAIEKKLNPIKHTATAVIVEPILQAAGGMKLYSQDFLARLAAWAKRHNIHLIADEIMTGIGRTGRMLASEHAGIQADFICLSKGLTSGWMPFSTVITSDEIYQACYDDYAKGTSFLHSHTYSGNALGASLALATLKTIEAEQLCQRAHQLQNIMREAMHNIANVTQCLHNIRGIGAVIAADLTNLNEIPRAAYQVCNQALKLGALLRPLGNTIYWTPPLTIEHHELHRLAEITAKAILHVKTSTRSA